LTNGRRDDARHLDHHVELRQAEVRTVLIIIGTRRDQLNRVGPENDEIADVLLEHGGRPRVIGVHLGAIADLVAAQLFHGGSGNVHVFVEFEPAEIHREVAQQVAGAEQRPARRVARDPQPRTGLLDAESVVSGRRLSGRELDRRPPAHRFGNW
jgi:hypothetical protein